MIVHYHEVDNHTRKHRVAFAVPILEKTARLLRSFKLNNVSYQGQKRPLSSWFILVEKTFDQSACAIEYQLARLTLTGSIVLARLCTGQKPAWQTFDRTGAKCVRSWHALCLHFIRLANRLPCFEILRLF